MVSALQNVIHSAKVLFDLYEALVKRLAVQADFDELTKGLGAARMPFAWPALEFVDTGQQVFREAQANLLEGAHRGRF